MKKLFLFTILSILLLSSCTPDDPTVELAPIIEFTISPNSSILPYGDNVTVSWNIQNFKSGTLNGEAITQAIESKVFQHLIKNTDFTIVANSVSKTATDTKTVTVGDWKSSRFGLLTYNQRHWVLNSYHKIQNGIVVLDYPLLPSEIGRYWIFFQDETYLTYDINNNLINPNGKWKLLENNTVLKFDGGIGSTFPISTLTEFVLSLDTESGFDNLPAIVRYTWKVPN